MEFNKNQKKIIEMIRDKKVFDITSYLTEFQHTKSFSGGSFQKTLSLGEHKYEYDFSQPQVIGSDLSDLYDFLFAWQYLKDNGLVLECAKMIAPQDLSVFFTEQKNSEQVIQFNKGAFKACQDQIGLRVIPSPGLHSFIKRNFRTAGERIALGSLRATWTAVIIALVFLVASAGFYAILYYTAKRETSHILNQMGVLQQNLAAVGRTADEIKDAIAGISDKVTSFLP